MVRNIILSNIDNEVARIGKRSIISSIVIS